MPSLFNHSKRLLPPASKHAFISSTLLALALPFLVSASPVDITPSIITKRDNPLQISCFKPGDSPTGTAANVDDAQVGTAGTVHLACGAISARVLKSTFTTCNLKLPAAMPAGTLTGTTPGGAYIFSVDGACAGAVTQFDITIIDTGAGDIGESPNIPRCDGSTNGSDDVTLCVSGMTLVKC